MGFDVFTVPPGPFSNINVMIDGAGTLEPIPNATRTSINRNMLLFGPINSNGWGPTSNYRAQKLNFKYIDNIHPNNPSAFATLTAFVQPGDKVEILNTGEIYTVRSILAVSSSGLIRGQEFTFGNGQVPALELDRPLAQDVLPPQNGRPNYRVIRQPRVIPALQPMKLPQEVVIDLTPTRFPLLDPTYTGGLPAIPADTDRTASIYMSAVSYGVEISNCTGVTVAPGPAPNPVAPNYVDILFSPSGELIPTSQTFGSLTSSPTRGAFATGASDFIALWVHAYGSPDLWADRQPTAAQRNADNQTLVAIHARTGMIGSYPVGVPGTYADPLVFVRTGKGRKSAETGP
jgi:hypothetical protein